MQFEDAKAELHEFIAEFLPRLDSKAIKYMVQIKVCMLN
jgi:hypothetical protein